MEPRALFEELRKLDPAVRRELSLVFQFAARGVAERLATAGLTPNDQSGLEHRHRSYADIALGLLESKPEKVTERIAASAELSRILSALDL